MKLSNDLVEQFVNATANESKDEQSDMLYGTVVVFDGKMYARLDGSEQLTPIKTTTNIREGDRVTVNVKKHSALITGNMSSPSATVTDLSETNSAIAKCRKLIATKVSTDELNAATGRIQTLETNYLTVNGNLEAATGKINELEANKLSVNDANAKFATIDTLRATNADIDSLTGNYSEFKKSTIEQLKADSADISELQANKLSATDADLKYANIDFTNIGVAAIKQFYATSGIIKDLVISDQTVTGEIVGVTIKGDLIEGNTIVADKLVMKGGDGLFYKLNISAANGVNAEQTLYNSINGSIITAKSITATQISVKDLVAFDATIAGFHIKDTAIYSTGKESVTSTVRGIYLGKDGQVGFGDGNNYIKFYIDADGKYKLGISAESLTFATGQNVKDAIDEVDSKVDAIKSIDSTTIGYLVGDSGTTPPTGIWSAGVPVVPNGKYLWCQKITTYTDDTHDYEYSVSRTGDKGDKGEQGIPGLQGIQGEKGDQGIQGPQGVKGDKGATGETGPQGKQGIQGVKGDTGATGPQGVKGADGKNGTSSYFHVAYANSADGKTSFSVSDPSNRAYIGTYVDNTPTDSTDPTKYTWQLVKGAQGAKGDQGIKGTDGTNGKTSYLHIAYANSADGKTGFDVSNSSGKLYIGQYTDFTPGDSTNPAAYSWTKIKGEQGPQGPQGKQGVQGVQGPQGNTGPQGPQGVKGDTGATGKGVKSTSVTYQIGSSGTSAPTGTWNTTVPSVSAGQYLWTKTVITYTDNATSTLYSVARSGTNGSNGKNGANGSNGKSIGSVVNCYLATNASSNVTSATSGWTTTVQSVSSSKKYLWNYEVVKYTDGTVASTTAPCIIGSYGDTGAKGDKGPTGPQGPQGNTGPTGAAGATGNGIKSITEYYTVSTSNSSAPTSWSTTVPAMTATNKYLWNYETVTYTNNTTASTAKRVIGVYGDKGNTGSKGDTGPQGPQGKQGNTGPTGPQGPQGKQGNTGATGPTGPRGVKGDGLDVKDTRSTNQPPSWYFANYPRTSVAEFKQCSVIGLSGNGNFCYLLTVVPWNDASGGYPKQTAKVEGSCKEYWRVGTSASAWSNWIECVQKGDVVNQVNSELKIAGNSISLTTGHFTISAKNLTLDSAGNATFSGTVKAASIEGGTIKGATITGSAGEFTESFSVDIPSSSTKGSQWIHASDSETSIGYTYYNASYLLNSYIRINNYGISINSEYDDRNAFSATGIPAMIRLTASNGISLNPGIGQDVTIDGGLDTGGLSIGGESVMDFVVSIGTTGGWQYRKWNSGFAECWRGISYSGVQYTNTYGSAYYCVTQVSLPFTFTSVKHFQGTAYGTKGLYYVSSCGITNSVIKFYTASAAKETNVSISVELYVTGTWK